MAPFESLGMVSIMHFLATMAIAVCETINRQCQKRRVLSWTNLLMNSAKAVSD